VDTDNDKDTFYDELERLFDRMPKYNSKIVLGDFNAKVGREEKYTNTHRYIRTAKLSTRSITC